MDFFDRGRGFLSDYSKSDVNDIFDVAKFKSRLTDNILSIKDIILNNDVNPGEVLEINEFLTSSSNVSELEYIGLKDIKGVLEYAIDGYDLPEEISPFNMGRLEYHANRDHIINK